ncbi:MAG: hypothetical protein HOV79_06660 [Hamadaea sp.]|nr:hypothetical protein [Hamadaea sp.]
MREETLHQTRSADGSRTVWATVHDDGRLSIEGQSLSRSADFFEYEWAFTVAADHVDRLREALGGAPGADPVPLLRELFEADPFTDLRALLTGNDVAYEFWSRVGD